MFYFFVSWHRRRTRVNQPLFSFHLLAEMFHSLRQSDGVQVEVAVENDRAAGQGSGEGAAKSTRKQILACKNKNKKIKYDFEINTAHAGLKLWTIWWTRRTHLSGRDSSEESEVSSKCWTRDQSESCRDLCRRPHLWGLQCNACLLVGFQHQCTQSASTEKDKKPASGQPATARIHSISCLNSYLFKIILIKISQNQEGDGQTSNGCLREQNHQVAVIYYTKKLWKKNPKDLVFQIPLQQMFANKVVVSFFKTIRILEFVFKKDYV